jgi:hypothetical protein
MNEQPLLRFDVAYPGHVSRLLIFVKWLLVLPHAFVIGVLGFAMCFTSIFAWFAILITGRYPRGLWGFALMVMRWQANVNAYVYLQRDEYPPFGDDVSYPVQFDLAYPERLSRGLIFIEWLLIIPHLIVLYILSMLTSLILVFTWFAILFTGRYPYSFFEVVTEYMRWTYRVSTYFLLMTDAYPPFSLGDTPSSPRVAPQSQYAPPPASQW